MVPQTVRLREPKERIDIRAWIAGGASSCPLLSETPSDWEYLATSAQRSRQPLEPAPPALLEANRIRPAGLVDRLQSSRAGTSVQGLRTVGLLGRPILIAIWIGKTTIGRRAIRFRVRSRLFQSYS
jgi:hypothetical protein